MGYVMFSDSHGLETQWQWTSWIALLVLLPVISTAVLSSGASAVSILKRRAGTIVLLLAMGVLFDSVSKTEYPVPTSGAIVITGASTGIGRAAAEALTKKGFTVWAGVRKESDAADIRATASTISGSGTLKPIIIDVTKTETIKAAVAEVTAAGEPLVALVNNAGVLQTSCVELAPLDMFRNLYNVNVFGMVDTTKQFLPLIRAAKGRIVNVGSILGDLGTLPVWSVYTSSKHAVEALTDALRNEMQFFGVSVSLIKPGVIKTDIFEKTLKKKTMSIPELADAEEAKLDGTRETKSLYRSLVEIQMTANKAVDSDPNLSTTAITDAAIVHAVTSPFPKTRYIVGPDANLYLFLDHWLPDRVLDAFMYWFYYNGGWRSIYAVE